MKNKIIIIFFVFFVVGFLVINLSIPYILDDRLYAHIFPAEPSSSTPWGLDVNHPIQSFGDVLLSQYHHYFIRNGRALIHTIVQCFCGLWGKLAYDICSALVFIGFSFLLTRICLGTSYNMKNFRIYVVPLLCLFFFSIPEPTCFYAGIAFGTNYLWSSTASLLFLYLFFKLNSKRSSIFCSILLCVLSYLCGCTHEGFTIAIAGGIFLYMLLESKNVSLIQKRMAIFYMLGTACLVFAPSNFLRANRLDGFVGDRMSLALNVFVDMRVSYLMLVSVIIMFFTRKKELIAFCRHNYIFFVMWGIAFLFIIAIGALNRRSVVGLDFFAFIIWVRLMFFVFSENYYIKIFYYANFLSVLFLCGVIYYQVATGRQYREIDEILGKSNSKDCIVAVTPIQVPYIFSRYVVEYPFDIPKADFEYCIFSWYFDKDNILIFENFQNLSNLTPFVTFFNEDTKVQGKNDFHKIGTWLYSKEPLNKGSVLVCHLGLYQAYDMKSLLKKLISYFYKPNTNQMNLTPDFEPFEFQNQTYYRMYMYPNGSREILSIDTTF